MLPFPEPEPNLSIWTESADASDVKSVAQAKSSGLKGLKRKGPALQEVLTRIEDHSGSTLLSVLGSTKDMILLRPEKKIKITGSVCAGPSGALQVRFPFACCSLCARF